MENTIFRCDSCVKSMVEFFPPETCIAAGLFRNIEIFEPDSGDEQNKKIHIWRAHDLCVTALVYTIDGRLVSGSRDGFVKMWDVDSTKKNNRDIFSGNPEAVEMWARHMGIGEILGLSELYGNDKEKRRFAVSGEYGSVRVLDGLTGQEIMMASIGHNTSSLGAVISLDRSQNYRNQTNKKNNSENRKDIVMFASSRSRERTIRVWAVQDLLEGSEIDLKGSEIDLKGSKIDLKGSKIDLKGSKIDLKGSKNKGRLGSLSLVQTVEVEKFVYSLSLSPCGQFVAAGCTRGYVKLYRIYWNKNNNGNQNCDHKCDQKKWDYVWSVLANHQGEHTRQVSWSPDGKLLATCFGEYQINILSSSTGVTLRTFRVDPHHPMISPISSFIISHDGTRVISGSRTENVVVTYNIFKKQDSQVASFVSSLFSLFVLDMDFYDGLIELHSFLNPFMVDSFVLQKKN